MKSQVGTIKLLAVVLSEFVCVIHFHLGGGFKKHILKATVKIEAAGTKLS